MVKRPGEAFGLPDGSHDDTDPLDPFQSVEWERYAAHARATLIPMLRESAIGVVLTSSGDPDVKQALEIGMMILMDKPLLLIVDPGQVVPPKLLKLADAILQGPIDRPGLAAEIQFAADALGEDTP